MNFLGFDISGIITFLKILGSTLSLIFFVGIVISILEKRKIILNDKSKRAESFNINHPKETKEQERWNFIKSQFQSKNPMEWRIAIIDADAMLEDLITELGYVGDGFAEKLKSMSIEDFQYIDAAWRVHKLRNILVHQGTSYHLSDREAYQTFQVYDQIFNDTGYIA